MSLNRFIVFIFLLYSTTSGNEIFAQACDSITPSFNVDLSLDPNATYVSPQVVRDGRCCNSTGNAKCIEFIVTLNQDAEGVIFDIFSGAVPGGALFYQINCGPIAAFGEVVCLSGPGPHVITFCKPGNNVNEYRITSVAEPVIPDSIAVNDGCSKELGTQGFDESTITWTTVFPGNRGSFNNYLNCISQCDTILVTPAPNYPPFIDIEVCGFPFGGCDTIYKCDTVRVNFLSTLSVDIFPEFPTICFGDTSISIEAIPSGGSPPYTYRWSTGDSTRFANVNTGTFWVELGDTSGCPPTYDTVVVTDFTMPISANAGNDTAGCIENLPINLFGSVVSASGGTWVGSGVFSPSVDSLNVTYQPSSNEIANGVSNLMLITTGNGTCPADTDYIQIDLLKFNATLNTGNIPVSCKGFTDGIAWAEAIGTRTPYTFLWDASTGNQIGDSAYNLGAGFYTVEVLDSAGCPLDTTVQVIESDSVLSLNITTFPVSCFGLQDGSVRLGISGGTPTYQVVWDPSLLNVSDTGAIGMPAGTYVVQITDGFGCVIDTSFTILGPVAPLTLAFSTIDVGCKNGRNGSATALPSGGTVPYSYMWDDSTGFQTSQTAINLKKGIYQVIVFDSMGCTISDTISIIEPLSPIIYTDSTTKPSCFGWGDGTATVFPSGGTPPYSYLWDAQAGNQTTQTATGLSAGIYSVTIFDQNSCLFATPIVVIDPMPLFATVVEIIHVSCKGGSNGSAKVTPVGGTGPYTYQWDSGTGFQTDSIATGLKAGIYSVLVHDQNACSFVPDIEILEPDDSLSVLLGSIPVSCKGGADGLAFSEVFGGTQPYTLQWSSNAASQTTDTAFNLIAGSYSLNVMDSNGCVADSSVIILEPFTALSATTNAVSTLCFGDSNGLAIVQPLGGVSPYTILWDVSAGGQQNDTAFGLSAGTYQVVLGDSYNCSFDTNVVINQPLPLSVNGSKQNVLCYGDQTGWAFVNVSGGVGFYSVQWDQATGNQTSDSAVGLGNGTYSVFIEDSNNCRIDTFFQISQPDTNLMLFGSKMDVDCFGDSSGMAFVSATGATPPYSYQWSANANAQTTDTAYQLKAGSYTVAVTDAAGCSDNYSIAVLQPQSPLAIVLGKKNTTCSYTNDGKAFSTINGGWPPYQYLWRKGSGVQFGDTARNLSTGYAFFQATDASGCQSAWDSIIISRPPPVTLQLSNSDTICIGDSISIMTTGSGGNGAPFSYELWPLTPVPPNFNVQPNQTTLYRLQALDKLRCKSDLKDVTIYVKDLASDSMYVSSSGDICLGDTVEIIGFHWGYFKNYKYDWNVAQTSLNFLDIPEQSQMYILTVTDTVCAASVKDSVFVEVFPIPELSLDPIVAQGCIPLTVRFKNLINDPSVTDYFWDFGDGNTSIDPTPVYSYFESGDFSIKLMVTNDFGCEVENDALSLVKAFPLPVVDFKSNPNLADMRKPLVEFTSLSSEGAHLWTFGDDGTSSDRDPIHQYADTGIYSVKLIVTDVNGCENEANEAVVITPYFNISVPNAFTPNPNGSNGGRFDFSGDNNYVFFPVTEGVVEYEMLIFNRWGELIFQSTNYEIGWDGYYKGVIVSQEVYVWKLIIKWENEQTFEGYGDVTVFR